MKNQKYAIFALFVAILIDALGWGVAFPVLAPVILHNSAHMFSSTVSLASKNMLYEIALSIYCIFMFLMSPVLGSLSDKYGRKSILIVSMLGNCIGFFISALSIPMHSYTVLLIGRSVAGATAGSIPIAQAGIIDISSKEQTASRLGLVVLGNVVGFAVGPVIGGFFMDQSIFGSWTNFQTPFFVSAAMGLFGALILFFYKETFQGNKTIKIHALTSFQNIYNAFSKKITLQYCMLLLCFLFGWGIYFSTMPVLLTERLGWTGSSIGYFIAYLGTVFALMILFVLPKITTKFQLKNIISFALIMLFVATILFASIYNSITPWFIIILTVAVPLIYVSTVTILSSQVSEDKQGEIMGVTGSIFALTWGVGPIIGAYFLRHGLYATYALAGCAFLLAFAISLLHKKKDI